MVLHNATVYISTGQIVHVFMLFQRACVCVATFIGDLKHCTLPLTCTALGSFTFVRSLLRLRF